MAPAVHDEAHRQALGAGDVAKPLTSWRLRRICRRDGPIVACGFWRRVPDVSRPAGDPSAAGASYRGSQTQDKKGYDMWELLQVRGDGLHVPPLIRRRGHEAEALVLR
jgi:hypothetical protein